MEHFDVVVIGSGALGASTAFHLAQQGRSVALLDKAAIASQTSANAAGLTGRVRRTELMTHLANRAAEKIERFAEETGEPMVYFQPGSLTIARRPEHVRQIEERVAMGSRLGLDIALVDAEQAVELMPFLHDTGILAVSHMRTDVFLEPVQIPRGYAHASARLGAVLMPHVIVTEIVVEDGAVTRVVTDKGEIATSIVVDAAGGWLRFVAGLAGANVPIVPMRHQLMITVPLEGVSTEQPVTRIIDANVYVRPDKGGLMFGGYERDPLPYMPDRFQQPFNIADVELDIAVLRRLADSVIDQFPILQDVAIQEHRGGLPTITADGEHILGPAPGIEGLYIIGGCNVGGLSIAPALGEELALWIVNGAPRLDLSRMSPARFGKGLSEAALVDQCRERYANYYSQRPA